ncbi:MAG: TonB family protein [Polyangiaceae bacterium]
MAVLELCARAGLSCAEVSGTMTVFRRRVSICTLLILGSVTSPSLVVAQPKGPDAGAPERVPPKPTNHIEPVFPESRKADPVRAVVTLTLTLDNTGSVTDVVVTSPPDADFDPAAIAAAKQLTFTPALVGGKAVAAKIPYRFEFVWEPAPKPVEVISGVISGVVRAASNDPIPGVLVVLSSTSVQSQPREITTGANGGFSFNNLPPGAYKVRVQADGLEPFESEEVVTEGAATEVVYRPSPKVLSVAGEPQEIQVVGERPPREVTRRVIEQRELQKMPGTNGDALRSLESFPGVARSPGITAQLIVRGAGPNDTAVFVDGTPIPIAYHFGGLTSVVPSEVLSKIDFTPGNFGAEYGRVMGGVVDIGLKSPRKDRWGGLLQVDTLDARMMAEGPLGKHTRVLLAARRSYVDAWLGPVLESTGALGVSTAPVYYDGQAMIEQDLGDRTTARLAFLFSDDRLKLTFDSPPPDNPITGLGNHTSFWRIQARTDTKITDGVRWVNTLAYGHDHTVFDFGQNFVDIDYAPLTFRSDLRARFSDGIVAIVGTDTTVVSADVSVKAPPIPEDGQSTGPFFARKANLLTTKANRYLPAAYAMLELSPVAGLKVLPGVRLDYTSELAEWKVSPRLAVRLDAHRAFPRTTLKGGVGLYMQPPQPYESYSPFGTPGLSSNRAIHYSAGFEQELTKKIELSAEGFYKDLDQLVDQRQAASTTRAGVDYANTGSGRIYGLEMLLRYRADERFFGWIAYTLSRSERRAYDAEPLHPFEFDQTHILTVLGSYKLGRGWEAGARFRYVSGNPYTPAVAAVLDADAGAYSPINGQPFSARSPAFHRLDVRIEKTWNFSQWKLSAYADVQNVYNRRNPEGRLYNFNYTRSDVVAGLPILPVIGVRGEL